MTDAEFRAWLARDNEERCVLVEMDYIEEAPESPVGPETSTLYFSDRVFFDDVTDHAYVDVVRSAPQYSRSLSGERLGQYTSAVGTLELDNADGGLDFLLNLACDGSLIRFYYGGTAWPVADFKHIFSAIVSKVSAPAWDRISVTLKDTGLLLNKSIGGTDTVGGTGPNADRARPANFGYIHNLAPLVIDETVDGGQYAHSDDVDTEALEVRDRGVSVAFTDDADGTFRLTAPPDGAITCDVLSEPEGDGNVMVSDAINHLIGERAGLTALSLYDGAGVTFTVHDADDYKVGISLPEARNVIDLLEEISDSGNLFWAVKRTGQFTFGRLRLNDIADLVSDSPSAIDEVAIVEDDIVPQTAFSIDHAPTQYYRFQAYMSRNWSRQNDLSDLLSPDEQAVFSRAGLYLMQPASVGTDYAAAPELYHKTLTVSPVIDTLLSEVFSVSDLDSLAQWMTTRRAMLLPWIEVVTLTVGIDFFELELGDPVRLFNPRFGADDGVLFQVIANTIKLTDARIDLRLARRNIIQPTPDAWLRQVSAQDESQQEYARGAHPAAEDEPEKPSVTPIDFGPAPLLGGGGDWIPGRGMAFSRMRTASGGFDTIVFTTPQAETAMVFRMMHYNSSTSVGSGEYTDYATYVADNTGGGFVEDFDGIATPGSPVFPIPSFAPVWTNSTQNGAGNGIYDSSDLGAPSDLALCGIGTGPGMMTLTFSNPLHAWGAYFASQAGDIQADFYLGATLIYTADLSAYSHVSDFGDYLDFWGFAL